MIATTLQCPGARERLALLIDEVLDAAYRAALHMCGDATLAADVVATAAQRAGEDGDALAQGTHFRHWFLAIVMDLARDVAPPGPDAEYVPSATGGSAEQWSDASAAAMGRVAGIEGALLSLPVALREVAVLYFGDNASSAQIAKVLRAPQVLVRERLHEAREAMRRHVSRGAGVAAT